MIRLLKSLKLIKKGKEAKTVLLSICTSSLVRFVSENQINILSTYQRERERER